MKNGKSIFLPSLIKVHTSLFNWAPVRRASKQKRKQLNKRGFQMQFQMEDLSKFQSDLERH